MKTLLLGLSLCASLAVSASAGTAFYTHALTTSSPTFDCPNASGLGTAVQYYSVAQINVDTTGSYLIEAASVNTSGTPSNALDTFLVVYASSFNPATPNTQIAFDDDFTGALTVLPGPYAGNGVTSAATGFSSTQPSSQILTVNLTAGTQYFVINSSFRSTDFVGTGTNAQPTGTFYVGISGPGAITLVSTPVELLGFEVE